MAILVDQLRVLYISKSSLEPQSAKLYTNYLSSYFLSNLQYFPPEPL